MGSVRNSLDQEGFEAEVKELLAIVQEAALLIQRLARLNKGKISKMNLALLRDLTDKKTDTAALNAEARSLLRGVEKYNDELFLSHVVNPVIEVFRKFAFNPKKDKSIKKEKDTAALNSQFFEEDEVSGYSPYMRLYAIQERVLKRMVAKRQAFSQQLERAINTINMPPPLPPLPKLPQTASPPPLPEVLYKGKLIEAQEALKKFIQHYTDPAAGMLRGVDTGRAYYLRVKLEGILTKLGQGNVSADDITFDVKAIRSAFTNC